MATPTLVELNYTSIDTAEATTGWTKFDTLDTDIKKEGNNAITGTFRTDLTLGFFDAGGAPVTAVGKHVRMWLNTTNLPYMENEAGGGYEFYLYDGSTSEFVVAFGSDTYFGGWKNLVFACDAFTTLTLANVDRWGIRINHHTSAKNVDNCWADFIRYMDGYYATGGTSGDEIDLGGMVALDIAAGYGILDLVEGVYFSYGELQIGNGSTVTWFEMIGEVLVFTDSPVAEGLYQLRGEGTGCRINIETTVIQGSGSADSSRFLFPMDDADLVSFSMTGSFLSHSGELRFKTGQTVTRNTFLDCGQIIAGGADFSGSVVSGYETAVGTGALYWAGAIDPAGELDDMVFVKGTAATNAIEFANDTPIEMTLTGIDFQGYNGLDDQDDSALHILRTSGTVTINLVGCTGTITYISEGATVDLISSKSATFTPLENGSAFTITKDSDNSILKDVASVTGGEVVYSYDGSLDDTATTVHIIIAGKEPIDFAWIIAEGTVPVSQITDRVYST